MDTARAGWCVAGLLLAAITAFQCVQHGVGATIAALIFIGLPWLPWPLLRLAWIPLALAVAYTFGPVDFPPFFTAALAWLTGIASYRVARGTRP